jgi:hypothetical protein
MIFAGNEGDRGDRRSRIYIAGLASKAVYDLSEGAKSTDEVCKKAWALLNARYSAIKHDQWDGFSFFEHPKDSALFKPREGRQDDDRFCVFAVKGTSGLADWLDNLDAGDDVTASFPHHSWHLHV